MGVEFLNRFCVLVLFVSGVGSGGGGSQGGGGELVDVLTEFVECGWVVADLGYTVEKLLEVGQCR